MGLNDCSGHIDRVPFRGRREVAQGRFSFLDSRFCILIRVVPLLLGFKIADNWYFLSAIAYEVVSKAPPMRQRAVRRHRVLKYQYYGFYELSGGKSRIFKWSHCCHCLLSRED